MPVLQEFETGCRFVAENEGVTAILMHKPNLPVSYGTPKKVSKKRIPTPEEEARDGAYQHDDGRLYIPALWVQRNMIEAGKAGLVWDDAKLTEYLRDPRGMIKGGKMAFPGLKKDDDLANVIAYLKTLSK